MEVADLANDFFKDIISGKGTTLFIAPKGSGKTVLLMSHLVSLLDNKLVDRVIGLIPSFQDDPSKSYELLNDYKNVVVYEDYTERIFDDVAKYHKKNPEHNQILVLEDATSFNFLFGRNETLKNIIFRGRAMRCTTIVVAHALSHVIKPQYRQNFHYIFMFQTADASLLKMLWSAYASTKMKFDDFTEMHNHLTEQREFQPYLIQTMPKVKIDINPANWGFIKKYKKKVLDSLT